MPSYSPCLYFDEIPDEMSSTNVVGTTRKADMLHPHPYQFLNLGSETINVTTAHDPFSPDAPCRNHANTSVHAPPYILAISPDDAYAPCRAWSVMASYWLNVSDCVTARERYGWEFSLCPRDTTRMTYDTNIDPINVNETTSEICVYTPKVPCSYNIIEAGNRVTKHQAYR